MIQKELRRSHDGISGVINDDYENLPEDLVPFNYYYDDGETGHVIMAIPECLLEEAEADGDLDMFECPIPVKYVLHNGYRIVQDHVVCDADYDHNFGLDVDESWFEV